jgi:hypothetical protein
VFLEQVGPFRDAGQFINNLMKTMVFKSSVFELMSWMEEVEAGLKDPGLPPEVKAQVVVDYQEIQRRFNQITGSVANG